jgi:ubiquinone/menaquinone biosynthesis C-methylase UbiE
MMTRRATLPILRSSAVTTEQQARQAKLYDRYWAGYTNTYRLENWHRSFIRRIFGALQIPEASPYLDIGVGSPAATVIEAARLGAKAVGCDLSAEAIERCRRFAEGEGQAERASFAVCPAEDLPLGDASFEAASLVSVLEHVQDDEAAVRELARVMRPGGRVWLTVPNDLRHYPIGLRQAMKRYYRRVGHLREYSPATLGPLFARHGFRPVAFQYTGHPVKFVQAGLAVTSERVRFGETGVWWQLERADLARTGSPRGAIQLSGVFERV